MLQTEYMRKKIFKMRLVIIILKISLLGILGCIGMQLKRVSDLAYNLNPLSLTVILLVSCWCILLIHEIGHCLAIKLKGHRVISIHLPLIQIRFGERFRVFKNSINLEGMVIPEIPTVTSEETMEAAREYIVFMLLGGPLFTSLFAIGTYLITRTVAWKYGDIPLLEICLLIILFESLFILINCFRSGNGKLGDVKAAQKSDRSKSYLSCRLYEWMFYQQEYTSIIKNSKYIKDIICNNIVNKKMNEQDENEILLSVMYYSICGIDLYFMEEIKKNLDTYMGEWLDKMVSHQMQDEVIYELYAYGVILIEKQGMHEKALKYYNQFYNLNIDSKIDKKKNYYFEQMDKVVNHKKADIKYSSHPDYSFFRVFENHYKCEETICTKI